MIKIGSHVGMSKNEMFLGSAKEAVSYGANTFMVYTGAPQNTKRRDISELRIEEGWNYMRAHGIEEIVIHAPYIINLANTVNKDTYKLAVEFLEKELERSTAMGSRIMVLHPGSHVKAGIKAGTDSIIKGLNEVLTRDTQCFVALETMAGKGSEIGQTFEELKSIYDGVVYSEKLRVCFDTCHTSDAGYDIINDFDGVIDKFDRLIGKNQIAVFHINDSKNAPSSHKDRHENLAKGYIGLKPLLDIIYHKDFLDVPKILETPYIPSPDNGEIKVAPYKEEIELIKSYAKEYGMN